MGSKMEFKLNLNLLDDQIRVGFDKGVIDALEIILLRSNEIIPKDSGTLANSGKTSYNDQGGEVVWSTQYARRRYYENYANSHTTLWGEKALEKNQEEIEKILFHYLN